MTRQFFLEEEPVTRRGERVTIISVEGRGKQPILGYIGKSTTLSTWGLNGRFYEDGQESPDDLLNLPDMVVRYVNIYRGKPGQATRAEADEAASEHRIACVRIECLAGQYDL